MRWALQVEYLGYGFCGWQKQCSVPTVQECLELALSKVAGESVSIVAAGRTDTGVHAVGQIVHFNTDIVRKPVAWVRGANTYLPDSVRVVWAEQVPDIFHARRSAISRVYRYVIYQGPVRPALYSHRVAWTHHKLSEEAIREALPILIGCHDFSSFRGAECQAVSAVREVKDISLFRVGSFWIFDIEANSFLQHMVRNIMGTMLYIGRGLRDVNWLSELLLKRNRFSSSSPTALPDGLYLLSVKYPAQYRFPMEESACLFPPLVV
ncbi:MULTISPECIES: tRNA pseudouridine(38-40) synthase TruA [Candidatus Ichthyocystis]|uniref:tRNA pseudouridine(38-40) synthase TruA n=1 Tax=Candidatus Ichthyocystis TaxID=2929841 RepID=UPI000B14C07C|nr:MULTISPECIES: tRNA pseudouridine(38-40) synthase TruA [Ichthyocystis]